MEKINDGGPAYPAPDFVTKSDSLTVEGYARIGNTRGMSLRDYFAAHAPEPPEIDLSGGQVAEAVAVAAVYQARWRYAFADAMIAERERRVK